MTLVWTSVAGFLYAEVIMVVLLLLPIRPQRWQKLFQSSLLSSIGRQSFRLLIVLTIFLLEAVREMNKYSLTEPAQGIPPNNKTKMLLFRAQRNFYISGFAIFLWLVIYRLVRLISSQASPMAQIGASTKHACSVNTGQNNVKRKAVELVVLALLVYFVIIFFL